MADRRLPELFEQANSTAAPAVSRRDATCGALTDGQLVMLTLNGGKRAFTTLSNRYDRPLRRLITRRTANIHDVDDIVQSVWIKAWQALGRYDVSRPFLNWLSVIATNQCRDHHRRSVSYATMLVASTQLAAGQGHGTLAADDIVASRHALADVRRQMQDLAPSLREALVESIEHQASHADIAHRLNVSPKAIEMRIRKARQHLRAALPHLM
ncbi:sigma-70 family RNA polymerase sigma factor [Altererythrobacter xixiisoli]|uniref:Sigma-70 family RNA polymerase sigma factor n=1 Tax=Croceibacterium xixiisoli TaxID=1476466 RepID=A0A6I4TYV4_9SPHN|nr:sigma-70 family RNA polymerase sigma factor [Croceibacterium xixiisoli]MXP00300.1 sigma-70 family RNA polymerase sigma factor [Croceibacterium xixiisoli]